MPADGHVTDPLVAELVGLYQRATPRLQALIQEGLRRGLDPSSSGTQAFRVRQQSQAAQILSQLSAQTERHVPVLIGAAYRAGALAVDNTSGPVTVRGHFGGTHTGAVEVIANNLTSRITDSLRIVDGNIRAVFARADRIERAGDLNVSMPVIGRRQDDPYRKAALQTIGEGQITGETRREMTSALTKKLVNEGVTDALTGFVDRAGRRWPLQHYAAMVTRTTTREAVSTATRNRLVEGGRDLVDISSHPHVSDECDAYDGQTFSLTGATPGYDVLDQEPPFHPNCAHVMMPSGVDLDVWESELTDLL